MSLATKMAAVESMLVEHFKAVGEPDKVEGLLKEIQSMGGTSEVSLQGITAADLGDIGLPKLLARRIAKSFGGGDAPAPDQKQIVIVDDNPLNLAARLKPEDLAAEYDPNDPTNPFGARLQQISGGCAFLVFTDDGTYLPGPSAKLLRELLDGYKPRKTYQHNGVLHEVFCVGHRPARFADEHPLFEKVMLRPGGMSDNHIEWGSLSLQVRQLIRLAVCTQEITSKEQDVFEDTQGKTFNELTLRWPIAAVQYKKLEGAGSLPSLKVPLGPPQK